METPELAQDGSCYIGNLKSYERLTHVIGETFPRKKSFDNGFVSDEVIDAAAGRGREIDRWCCLFAASNGTIEIPQGVELECEEAELDADLSAFARWWALSNPGFIASQLTVFNDDDGIAGTMDLKLILNGKVTIVDLKRTAAVEKSWGFQLGGLAAYDEDVEAIAVLHIHPKFAKGYIWRPYERDLWVSRWRQMAAFWKMCKGI